MMLRISLGEKGVEGPFFFDDFRKLFLLLSNVAFEKYADKAWTLVPGAEARTAALAKIGGGASRAHGDLTMNTAKGSAF